MTSTAPTRRRSWLRAAAPMVAAVLTVAGCGGLPTSNTVERGLPGVGAPVQGFQALPDGPQEDATPEDIVSGFLLANVGFEDDHEVARQFLTADLTRTWQPTSNVVVYSGEPQYTMRGDSAVIVSVAVRGVLDADGYLVEQPEGTTRNATFALAQDENDDWRISGFPQTDFGLWLTYSDFTNHYRFASVTYLAGQRDVTVPDNRWFPRNDGLVTAMARAQVQEPPAYLVGAVRTGFPEGTQLRSPAVAVSTTTGVATVDLVGPPIEGEAVRQSLAQLAQTMVRVAPGVTGVVIQDDAGPVQPDDSDSFVEVTSAADMDYGDAVAPVTYALLRRHISLMAVDPYSFDLAAYQPAGDDPAVPELPTIPVNVQSVAADDQVLNFAAVSSDRTTLHVWHGVESRVQLSNIGIQLTAPGFDQLGYLWVGGQSERQSQVWVLDVSEGDSNLQAVQVDAPWLIGTQQLRALAVGPDDSRAIVVTRDPNTRRDTVGITGIVRDSEGVPVELTEPRPIGPGLTQVTSLSWLNDSEVAVLGASNSDATVSPYVLTLGGWTEKLRTLPSGVRDVKGIPDPVNPADSALVLVDTRGRLYTQERTDWLDAARGSDLVIPGN